MDTLLSERVNGVLGFGDEFSFGDRNCVRDGSCIATRDGAVTLRINRGARDEGESQKERWELVWEARMQRCSLGSFANLVRRSGGHSPQSTIRPHFLALVQLSQPRTLLYFLDHTTFHWPVVRAM